jgi:hypothetical protein
MLSCGAFIHYIVPAPDTQSIVLLANARGSKGVCCFTDLCLFLFPTSALPAGHVYAVHTDVQRGGNVIWKFHTGHMVRTDPALSLDGKTLVVGTTGGQMFAINTEDGTEKWRCVCVGVEQHTRLLARATLGVWHVMMQYGATCPRILLCFPAFGARDYPSTYPLTVPETLQLKAQTSQIIIQTRVAWQTCTPEGQT